MKVTAIKELHRKKDNKAYWRVDLESTEVPLLLFSKPQVTEGTDIPADKLEMSGKEGNYYWKFKEVATESKPAPTVDKPPEKTYGKSKDEQESIKRQSARRDAVEIYKHCTEAGTPFAKDLFEDYLEHMLMYGDPLIAEAVKMGGKTK